MKFNLKQRLHFDFFKDKRFNVDKYDILQTSENTYFPFSAQFQILKVFFLQKRQKMVPPVFPPFDP